MSRTPATWRAAALSMDATVPPRTGVIASVPIFMPGRIVSMPNCAVPLTFAGVSSRGALVPIRVNCAAGFKGIWLGTGCAAASPATSP